VCKEREERTEREDVLTLFSLLPPFSHRWSMSEDGDMEGERESGIPTVMVVGKDGEELAHLDVGMKGIKELDKWNYAEWKWT
jgi:hypothetical protein